MFSVFNVVLCFFIKCNTHHSILQACLIHFGIAELLEPILAAAGLRLGVKGLNHKQATNQLQGHQICLHNKNTTIHVCISKKVIFIRNKIYHINFEHIRGTIKSQGHFLATLEPSIYKKVKLKMFSSLLVCVSQASVVFFSL